MVDDEIFVSILNDRLYRIKLFHLIPIYISLSYKIICFTSNSINVMTFLQIVPGSIIASLSNYHRIYLICRIHAIHKLPMLKTIESAYLPQYPLDLTSIEQVRSIDQPIALPRTLESRPPLHLVDGEDLGVAMIQKELCHTTRNRPEPFRVYFGCHISLYTFATPSFVLNHQTLQSSCFFIHQKQADCSLTLAFRVRELLRTFAKQAPGAKTFVRRVDPANFSHWVGRKDFLLRISTLLIVRVL